MSELDGLLAYQEDSPPPYKAAISNVYQVDVESRNRDTRYVTCRVCQNSIDVTGKTDQCVVKCAFCQEATPINNAPPGKKYVRCPCNCLLVCKISSQRIACPRPNCKRTIDLGPNVPPSTRTTMFRIICKHCDSQFQFDVTHNTLAKCPHCQKVSSIGPEFARNRAIKIFKFGILPLILFIVLFVSTIGLVDSHKWLYVLYIMFFLFNLAVWSRFFYYFNMKISLIQGPVF